MGTMSQLRREKILKVIDGDPRLIVTLAHWNNLNRADDVLDWLISNRLTGRNLWGWLTEKRPATILDPLKYIFSKIEKKERHAVFAHDFH